MTQLEQWLNQLIQGNCLELLKQLKNDCIDLVVTSPPYGKLRLYNGYEFDFEGIAKQLFRVLMKGGVLVWVVNDETVKGTESGSSFKQALFFKSIGFRLHDTMIWQKTNPPPHDPKCKRYTPAFEYMFVLSKGKPKTCNYLTEKTIRGGTRSSAGTQRQRQTGEIRDHRKQARKYQEIKHTKPRSNIWRYPTINKKSFHPAPFPLALAQDHILTWSNIAETVLDPMSGSGTTLLAAKRLDRSFVGFEVSQTYIDQVTPLLNNSPMMFGDFNNLLER